MILPAHDGDERRPIITLTTDFGLSDHYVGTMKGVLLNGCPQAALVDITHEIRPYSLFEGAYALAQAAPCFPAGTVHLVVVDPGVGSERKAAVVECDGQTFVAPDNGILSMALDGRKFASFLIENRELLREPVSRTFHGRDVFAPVAAALASGAIRPEQVGSQTVGLHQLEGFREREVAPGQWGGRVLSVDRFGNIVTNFSGLQHQQLAEAPFRLAMEGGEVSEFHHTFSEAPPASCFAYIGSSGFIEVGMNQASAAAQLGAEAGAELALRY